MVYFVGAGAGDPELLTVKGKRLIDNADTIIYAGSLVNPAVLADRRPDCQVYDSAGMTLEEVLAVMQETEAQGKTTVRVHTGDASIYGAIREQLDALDKLGIPHTVVPGVSSFLAAAAAMQKEYTLPDVTQTVILTRMEGRTPVPERERLEELAKHRATMIIFLSVGRIAELAERLRTAYPAATPVAVVQGKLAGGKNRDRNPSGHCRESAGGRHYQDCTGDCGRISGGHLCPVEAVR